MYSSDQSEGLDAALYKNLYMAAFRGGEVFNLTHYDR